jgi:hypothetical protein
MALSSPKVKLVTGSTLKATVSGTSQLQTTSPITLKTSVVRFDQLADVVEGTPNDGDFVVYRAYDDKYVLKSVGEIELPAVDVDGGTF